MLRLVHQEEAASSAQITGKIHYGHLPLFEVRQIDNEKLFKA